MADSEKTLENPGSIAGIVIKNGLVFIAKRSPIGQMGSRWEFPGGKIEAGETQEQALHREFLEEFNCDVVVHQPLCQAQFEHNGVNRGLFAWLVSFVDDNPDFLLTEHTDTAWVSVEDIENLSFVDSDLLLYPSVKKYMQELAQA